MRKRCLFLLAGFLIFLFGLQGAVSAADTVTPFPEAVESAEIPAPLSPKPATVLVDLNSATTNQLKTLPWIGEIYSRAIIKGRPYTSKDDFAARRVIPSVTYEKLKDLIVVAKD